MSRADSSLLEGEVVSANFARWNADRAFRSVIHATADKAGLEFLRHLVKNLSEALGVDCVFVAEFADAADTVRTIAFWHGERWLDNVEYRLAGTPCEKVLDGEFCLYRDHLQSLFPGDSSLAEMGARSYVGIPLRSAQGQVLGHLAALDSRPMSEDPRAQAIFEVFANRARVELERLHAEAMVRTAQAELELRLDGVERDLALTRDNLDLAYGELQALLEINQSSARHLRRDDLFAELSRCVRPLLPAERFGIEEPTGPDSLRVHVLALDRPASGPMIEEFGSAGTACRWAQENRQWYVAHSREELRERFPMTFEVMEREGMESLCALPLLREERSFGALFFMSTRRNVYRSIRIELLTRVASAVAVAVDNCFAYEEVARLRDRLATENVYLQEEIRSSHNVSDFVGNSPVVLRTMELVETVAGSSSTVLILGETGTGKELVARAIHDRSPRRDRALVKVNCSAISAGLVESELFGHVKGAFTGALSSRAGRFELADGGTIFLDEVGELPHDTQVKLLRVLQEREIEPVGSAKSRKVDVRVIAATNRDLAAEVAAGRFRADLYFRLNVFPITMPPLRERQGDIDLLARYFVDKYAREIGKNITGIAPPALQRLRMYDWPGNVRELSNLIQRAVLLARGPVIDFGEEFLPVTMPGVAATAIAAESVPVGRERTEQTLEAIQRQHIFDTLERTRWIIEGPTGAATLLGTNPSTLRYRMQKLGIHRPAQRV